MYENQRNTANHRVVDVISLDDLSRLASRRSAYSPYCFTLKSFVLKPLKLGVLLALGISLIPTAYAADGLIDLGVLNGGSFSAAYGISADGSVVVGLATDGAAGDASRAFRWTQAGGMVNLGTLNGGNYSTANGVSADGSVVVGRATDGAVGNANRAFHWTQAGGMQSLGVLNGGNYSAATGVSADGSVVVGLATDGAVGNASRAFRWTQAGGMVSLGVLNGGNYSTANGVSADGSVTVGQATDGAESNASRAFRWTQAGGMVSLGALNGGDFSVARGVSADGSVIVGQATDGAAGNASRAFRWTQAGGMVSLGALNGGDFSAAYGVSADGSVVVGQATDGAAGNDSRAFRWTQASGMQSVEQWLTANGVTVSPSLHTYSASATNSDGSVVVGKLNNNQAFLARVSSTGSGMIDTVDFNRTLAGSAYTQVQVGAQSALVLNGLHSARVDLLAVGQHSAWVGGDWGRQSAGSDNGDLGTGEVGFGYGITAGLTARIALGRTYSQLETLYHGDSTLRGTYVLPELVAAIPHTPLRLTASAYLNKGDADIKRGYLNAGTQVISSGNPDAEASGLRLRLDWLRALERNAFAITPYTSLTYTHSHVDGYTETGGGFPIRWDSRSDHTTEARVGGDAEYALNQRITLLGKLEGVHRFEGSSSGASGTILGLNNFSFAGQDYHQNWIRAGLGATGKIGPGTASLMVNRSTDKNGPAYWAYANYQIVF
jgi:probable HAF family extracellular repeat protein